MKKGIPRKISVIGENMKEIEILVEIYDDIDKVKEVLNTFSYGGFKRVKDEYYYDPKRKELKPDNDNKIFECLRLREKDNEYMITYKHDIYDKEKWIYSDEYETGIESIDIVRKIFEKLGLVKFIEIDNEKEVYNTLDYEIVLENVKDLGLFMEVEYCTNQDVDVLKIKEDIQKFIDNLGIRVSEELNMGKPELFLKRHNIKIEKDS